MRLFKATKEKALAAVNKSPASTMAPTKAPRRPPGQPQRTTYTSVAVDIPGEFLKTPPEAPITFQHVSFAKSEVPEYDDCFAVVIDNVLSPAECAQLLNLAEQSVPVNEGEEVSPWRPALVNMGVGWEIPITDYRNSDRIIWDNQVIVDRLWERCLQAQGEGDSIEKLLSKTPNDMDDSDGKWNFERLNNRMRFLKYTKGQFFKPHRDGPYHYKDNGTDVETHYTVHLYLSDSKKHSATGCVGGATSFLAPRDEKRRLDVDPKMGSVLIFQHQRLLHQGAEVHEGTKYTMRTDILYRWMQH